MKYLLRALFALALIAAPCTLPAQTRNPTQNQNQNQSESSEMPPSRIPYWKCELYGDNVFFARLNSIASVSIHTYNVDGVLNVDEVTVSTVGSAVARFYYIAKPTEEVPSSIPQKLSDRAESLLKKAAGKVGAADDLYGVQKIFPQTTHARIIEYRLREKKHVKEIYESLEVSLRRYRSATFRIKE